MPELPEVEIIKRGLVEKIVGLKVVDIEVLNRKSFQGNQQDFIESSVKSIFRRAKMLGIEFTNDKILLIHLKMSGQLILVQNSTKGMSTVLPNKSTRVMFSFNNGAKLYFNDQRKFGWIKQVDSLISAEDSLFKKLGPEPLNGDFTAEIFVNRLQKRKNTPVKVAIMDQTVLAGVGNIYASEGLFLARIKPTQKVVNLTDKEVAELFLGIRRALQEGIKHGGSTRSHFVNAEGRRGSYLDFARVYSKEGQPCPVCGGKIKRMILGGRSSFYCPNCQK